MKPATWERRWASVATAADRLASAAGSLSALAEAGVDDGFRGGGGGIHGSDPADPTTAVALAEPMADLVGDWLDELEALARDSWQTTARCLRLLWLIEHRGNVQAGRVETGGHCLACGRYVSGSSTDRLRSGYCDACRKAFERWRERASDPGDHVAFRAWRAAFLRQAESAVAGLGLGSRAVA